MDPVNIFVSVGTGLNSQQEAFVRAVENRLRSEGLIPCTVGRNTFCSEAPLEGIVDLMRRCSGAVIIALERTYFPAGVERRGGGDKVEKQLSETRVATPWNQVEAGMAHLRGLPLLVLVEEGVRGEGLLEGRHPWTVQTVELSEAALTTPLFNGVLASWKEKIAKRPKKDGTRPALADMTLLELATALKPAQAWSLLTAMAALIGGAFTVGAKLSVDAPQTPPGFAASAPSEQQGN